MPKKPSYEELELRVRELELAESERRLEDQTAKNTSELLSSFIKHSPIYAFIKEISSKESKVLYVSDNYIDMCGIPASEMVGKPMAELFPADFANKITRDDIDVVNKENKLQLQEKLDGRQYTTHKFPIIMGDKKYLAGYTIDITELKRVEESLRESEQKYRNLYHYAQVGLFEINLADGKIINCNQRYCDLAGYPTVQNAIGKDIIELYSNPADREEVIAIVDKQGFISDHVIQLKNHQTGKPFWAEFSIRMDRSRNIVEGSILDITGRKQAEEEKRNLLDRLSRAEKMESLGVLAGGVAHDLNNVLGVVLGHSELLLMKADERDGLRPQLEAIMQGGQKAAAIVDDLLTLARRSVARMEIVNLNQIITDCLQSPELAALLFHNSSVKIKTDLKPDLQNISGSPIHIGKSIYNLVVNGCEAMVEGGTVTLRTTNLYLDEPVEGYEYISEGEYVVLSVSDEGEGIHETDVRRIFEPFYTKKVMGRRGTGLGLAVVWGMVKDHKGYVDIQTVQGKGSTFTLYFPLTRAEISPEQKTVAVSEYTGNGETILVVDDVKEQRDIARLILEELNYSVSTVGSGEEALVFLGGNQVDLLVLDMIMEPGMDGLDTFKRVLDVSPGQKAIVVSGFSESDRVKAVLALGAGKYLRKPYVIEKLGLAVKEELS